MRDPDALESFALLGPGWTGRTTLASPLAEVASLDPGQPTLVLAPFEATAPRLFAAGRVEPAEELPARPPRRLQAELVEDGYLDAVEAVREAIAAGDVYQVCLSRRARLSGADAAGLASLLAPRGRFGAWVRLPGGEELVSASPELFFSVRDGRVASEPMKGTAPPGAAAWLESSAKYRCELAMITDLVRNDLTPVCRPGTVRVARARRLLELPYAVQAVSEVEGELAEGAGPLGVLASLHPGGSVTGAPKRAALSMIRRLERSPRGAYCGALGLCAAGAATFALLIRTAQKDAQGWWYGVGSGVVWDSQPRRELEELHLKLGALCATRS